jgi:hypothetical protein
MLSPTTTRWRVAPRHQWHERQANHRGERMSRVLVRLASEVHDTFVWPRRLAPQQLDCSRSRGELSFVDVLDARAPFAVPLIQASGKTLPALQSRQRANLECICAIGSARMCKAKQTWNIVALTPWSLESVVIPIRGTQAGGVPAMASQPSQYDEHRLGQWVSHRQPPA